MKFSREEFRINFASLRLHSTARALAFSLFLWIVWEMMWVICKQQKNYNETEKWIVWAPGLMNIIVSSQKYEGEERSF
jgi:heme A synthase